MSKKKYRLSVEQQSVMSAVLRGGALHMEYRDGEEIYCITNGPSINGRSARALITHGFLEPVGDGLFGNSQTFRPKEPCEPSTSTQSSAA